MWHSDSAGRHSADGMTRYGVESAGFEPLEGDFVPKRSGSTQPPAHLVQSFILGVKAAGAYR